VIKFLGDTEEPLVKALRFAPGVFTLKLPTIHLQQMAGSRYCCPDAGQ
jgi:hypothetical protein